MNRAVSEIKHFTQMDHIWWGAKTAVGQRRYDNKAEQFQKYCSCNNESNILEIGCGDGEFTKRIMLLGARIVATDITPEVIKRGKKNIKSPRVSFILDNSEKIRFRKNSYDIVCGISILHHLNTRKALQEAFRVLKKGGEIFFTEPNMLNPVIYIGHHISWLRPIMEYSPSETALVRWHLDKMLRETGFRHVEVRNYDFLHPQTPQFAMRAVEKLSHIMEGTPLLKEISGSLLIYAIK